MPVSDIENKQVARQWIDLIDATGTVIDIGAGVGTYKALLTDTKAQWVGIEVYQPYIEKYNLTDIYPKVVCADARYVDYSLFEDVNLVIAGDVLEHMPRNDAIGLIDRLKKVADNIIISIPIIESHQGTVDGNVYETHHYQWDYDEMLGILGHGRGTIKATLKGEVLGYYWWSKESKAVNKIKELIKHE